MDLQIPVLLDDDPVPVTCDFENTLVRMEIKEDGTEVPGAVSYQIHQLLLSLYEDQDITLHILTERSFEEDEADPEHSVATYCARIGLPISEVHYVPTPALKLAELGIIDPALHLDDDEDVVETAAAAGTKCILIVNDSKDDKMELRNKQKDMVVSQAVGELEPDAVTDVQLIGDLEEEAGETLEIGGEQFVPISGDDLIKMLSDASMDDEEDESFTPPDYMPVTFDLPARQTQRSTAVGRLQIRNAILSGNAPPAVLPLLDDITELSVSVTSVLIKLAESEAGRCPACHASMDGAHTPSEIGIPCWVGELNDLSRRYTA